MERVLQDVQYQQLKAKITNFLVQHDEIILAYLFGSTARGTAGPLSDIDLAIYLDRKQTAEEPEPYGYQGTMAYRLMSLLQKKVDLIILNQSATILKFRVIRDGNLVLCRSEKERVKFHEQTLREYHDLKPLLDVQKQYLRKRLAEGTFGGGKHG